MPSCARKSKSFTIRQASWALALALFLQASPAGAATAVDFPVFHLANQWLPVLTFSLRPIIASGAWNRSADDRAAVETILLEAAGDGEESMIAVGEAIRNRCELFGKNARAVCLQPKQFSGWNDRARADEFLRDHRGYYTRAWVAWKLSASTSYTKGATDYHEKNILPYWASAYKQTAQVGSHIYYVRQAGRIRG